MDLLQSLDLQTLTAMLVDYGARTAGAVAFLLAGWIAAGWLRRAVGNRLQALHFDPTLSIFFATAARWAVLIAVIITCLGIFGVPMTTFAAMLGAGGLAVGLALQGTLGHFAAGILLLALRPFKVGDVVNAAGVKGKVAEIQLFTTVLDTPDKRRIFVPNGLIVGNTIENVTYQSERRVNVNVGCAYNADIDETRRVLERAASEVPGRLNDPQPAIFLRELGPSSVDWSVRVWARTDDYWDVYEALVREVKNRLDEAGIAIPFPQMDVHVDGRLIPPS